MTALTLADGRALRLCVSASPVELDAVLAASIAANLAGASAAAPLSLAVSGGRTPLGLFFQLAASAVPWTHVAVTLVDDRWLPQYHADSNAGLVRRALLQGEAAQARWLPLVPAEASGEPQNVGAGETGLDGLPWPLQVCVLGMGNDGHTASLFPCAKETAAALAEDAPPLVAVRPTSAPYARVSLSLPPLAAARHLYLHIVGEQKLEVLRQALAGGSLPIARVLAAARGEVAVHWSPDHA